MGDAAPLLPAMAEMKAVFEKFDTSGDGYVSLDELSAALAKAGKAATPAECKEILASVDVNKDGQIEFDEFVKIYFMAPDKILPGLKTLKDTSSFFLSALSAGAP